MSQVRPQHRRKTCASQNETPLPDSAPFAAASDEEWRAVQRRRHLIQMVETLANGAREEGFRKSAAILNEAAENIRLALITSDASSLRSAPQRNGWGADAASPAKTLKVGRQVR